MASTIASSDAVAASSSEAAFHSNGSTVSTKRNVSVISSGALP
jgi:hypothetical protein